MRHLILAACLSVVPVCAIAQESTSIPQLDAGARVRVWPDPNASFKTRVQSFTGTTLELQSAPADQPRVLELNTVQRIDLSRGKNRLLWTAGGLLAGATLGVLISRSDGDEGSVAGGLDEVAEGLANTISGALIGGVIGFVVAPERWRTVWTK